MRGGQKLFGGDFLIFGWPLSVKLSEPLSLSPPSNLPPSRWKKGDDRISLENDFQSIDRWLAGSFGDFSFDSARQNWMG